ncbi:methyltransferase domain-containing protein [Agrobacterium sp. a22-2]|uniref:class I SAM-dependent methyltransferase n=1 Tax=Agrobacterium sp. a22-2 TaxID=2283840 RepID=UPI001445CA6C|nr:class I SAM-dependent methyltransferase [Agrobacterium sp. a22-2]NKN37321.1 methyltransferase domain-containing protein [Agrobacterium sp. a22-2]
MANWHSGYIDELSYTHGFYRQLTPSILNFAALSRGQKFDLSQSPLEYCELGCGQGFSTNLLAAANPQMRFHAMDFNPAHIANARNLASDAKLTNVRFYENAFADFLSCQGLPEGFDIIVLHGVLTWVSEENRRHIVDFLSAKLKPGGLVYVSYNAMPGWAVTLPLRRLLVDRAARTSGPLAPRIDDALTLVTSLAEVKSDFFKVHVAASARLKSMTTMARNYLAHEYFNRDWTPFYFEDVAAELAEAKLSFVGSLNLLDQFDDISLSEEQRKVLDAESDPIRREGLRDFVVNQLFRTDLFCKGRVEHTDRSAAGVWLDMRFALSMPAEKTPPAIKTRMGEIDLKVPPYPALIKAFSQGQVSTRGLLESNTLERANWRQITQAITVLVGANFLQPCLPDQNKDARIESCRLFNLAVCKHAENSEDHQFLASPVTGGGLAINRADRLFMLAINKGKELPADWASDAWRILAPQGHRLLKDGKMLMADQENQEELLLIAEEFARHRLPTIRNLQITL